jgi:glycosyltransferase involved in cell wall biosynthesis
MPPLRLAVACDYPEEGWTSMDLVGRMILAHLAARHADAVAACDVRPPFRRRLTRADGAARGRAARNADRLLNRFVDYPRAVRGLARVGAFDLLHVVDHSYSQLVHAAPPGRAVVTCHDLDTFACLLEPARCPRPLWFRAMTRRILAGLREAAAIACDTEATAAALRARGLVDPARIHVVPLGIDPACTPEPDPIADASAARLLGPADPQGPPELLHVGSTIPRKRIDVLLEVVAAVRRAYPDALLVRVGGALEPAQQRLARSLGLADAVVTLPFLDRATLAAVYRRAAAVLQPSEAEGFGLPVAEALACGAAVLASDIPALREVGGAAARFLPVGAVASWAEAAADLIEGHRRRDAPWHALRAAGPGQAARFGWPAHVDRLVAIYHAVLAGAAAGP